MTRTLGLSGFGEGSQPDIEVSVFNGETLVQRQRATRLMPARTNYLWQFRNQDDDAGDGEGGGESISGGDPGNPADFDPADYIGPDGAKVPDLDAIYVTVSRKSGPFPLGVAFQLRSADPNFHNFVLFGTAEWMFSARVGENYPFRYLDGDQAGATAGTASGPYVAHTYQTAGTHSWAVILRYPGLADRTITNDGVLLARNNLGRSKHLDDTDVPAWTGLVRGTRNYTMTAVTTGGRINLVMTNALGTRRLRNIALADAATGADVAAAIKAAYDAEPWLAKEIGLDFAATDATLTVRSDCQRGATTLSIEAGDAAGVTWVDGAPDFSTPAPAQTKATRYAIPSAVATGGALVLSISNALGTANLGPLYFPTGRKPWEIAADLFERMRFNDTLLKNTVGVTMGSDGSFPRYLADGTTQVQIDTNASKSPVTITLAAPDTPAGVTWAAGAPDLSATVPGATGADVGAIVVADQDEFYAGRTLYASTAYPDGVALKAAAASLGIPGNLANGRYFGGPEAFKNATRAEANKDLDSNGVNWRVLLHAGQTYPVFDGATAARPGSVNLHIDRFGKGPDPRVTVNTDTFTTNIIFQIDDTNYRGWTTFANIDFDGPYDSANPPFSAPWMARFINISRGQTYGLTLHRCRISGWRDSIIIGAGHVFSDCLVTSWYDYGFFVPTICASAFAGVAIKQKLGTVNAGKYSTGTAVLSDRYRFPPAASYTAKFGWSLEPAGGPERKSGAPVVPEGFAAPATGGWETHPAGPEAWAWWHANWKSFTWKNTNKEAFDHENDDLYLVGAQHGPCRFGGPSHALGMHQSELRSLNGWSRSGRWNGQVSALEQQDDAFAVQPCIRLNTAPLRPSPRTTACFVDVGFQGGGTAIVYVPQRTVFPSGDAMTPSLGVLIDRIVFRAMPLSNTAFTAQYGRLALRNSVAVFTGTALTQQNNLMVGGAENPEPPGSSWNYVYNNTFVFGRDLMAFGPNANNGLARVTNRALGKRMVAEWNNLVLQYAPVRNSADFAAPSTFAPLADALGIGFGHAPQAGSSVLEAAVAPVPYRDGDREVRPADAAVGAVEAER